MTLMRRIDEEFTKHPFYGARRMKARLRNQGYWVNRKRVSRLMRLLNGLTINAPDQAWCTDITYIRLAQGFVYLVAIMDWHSRYVPAWELSTTLEKSFCLETLRRALQISKPGIFNTDQGTQFTSPEFTGLVESEGIKVSMDGRGRVYDNIFVERLWRSVKYEEVYLHDYQTVPAARSHLSDYFEFYNNKRPHEALGYRTPHEVYFGTKARLAPASEAVV